MPAESPRRTTTDTFHPYAQQPVLLPKQSAHGSTLPTTTTLPPMSALPLMPPMPQSLTSAAPLLRRSAKAEETTKTIPTDKGDLLLSTFQVKLPPPPPSAKKSEAKETKSTKTAQKLTAALEERMPQNVSKRVLQNRKAQKRFRIRRQEHLKDLEKRAELLEDAYTHIEQLKNANTQLVQRLQQMEQFIRINLPTAFGPSTSTVTTVATTSPISAAISAPSLIPTITIHPYDQLGVTTSSPGQWQTSDTLSDSDNTDFDPQSVPSSPLHSAQNPMHGFLKDGFVDSFNTMEMDPRAFLDFPEKENIFAFPTPRIV